MISAFFSKYVWLINLILLAALSYRVALVVDSSVEHRLVPTYLARPANAGQVDYHGSSSSVVTKTPRSAYNIIISRNIFGISNPYSDSPGSTAIDVGGVRESTLNLDLLGTVVRSETEVKSKVGSRRFTKERKSKAVIKNVDSGLVRTYAEGDVIDIVSPEQVRLLQVNNCVAVVRRRGNRELIACKRDFKPKSGTTRTASSVRGGHRAAYERSGSDKSRSAGISKIAEGSYEIDRKFLEEKLSNLNDILTQARVIPRDDGLKFLAIRRNSLFYKIGLRNGDTLHKINDVALNNIENALGLFEDLKYQSSFRIDLTRRGKRLSQDYTVK